MTKDIHSFWIEGKLSDVNLLTIRSFKEYGHNFIIHTYDDKLTTECELRDASEVMKKEEGKYYKGLHKNMRLGLFGDTLRAKLLYKYGGIHVDMDVTCLKPFYFNSEYVFRPHDSGVVMNVVKCPKESSFAKYYINYTENKDVNENDWEGSFSGLINGVKELSLEKYIQKPEVLGMDNWVWWKDLLEEDKKPLSEYCIHWCYSTRFQLNYKKGSFYDKLLKKYGIC